MPKKIVLSSSTSEGGPCSSETKNNRRTVLRPKLFISKSRVQKQRPQSRKPALGLSPGEDYFCSSETKHNIRTEQRTKLFASARKLQELR
jgi:hypothetical protein